MVHVLIISIRHDCNVRIDDVYHMYVCGYISIHDIVHVKSYPSKMLRARNMKHGNLRRLGECETAHAVGIFRCWRQAYPHWN